MRQRISSGELRHMGRLDNKSIYFDTVLKTYVYLDLTDADRKELAE